MLTRYRPSRRGFGSDLFRLQQDLDRFLGLGLPAGKPRRAAAEFPALRIHEGAESATLTAELPGIAKEDLELNVLDDTVTIKGLTRVDETSQLSEGTRYHRRERSHGEFTRTLRLPWRIDADGVTATLQAGVLTVVVLKAAEDQARKINVQ